MQYKNQIDLSKIGKELNLRRRNAGLSLERVSLECEYNAYSLGKLESGKLDDIKLQSLNRLAVFYNMTLTELLMYGNS